MGLPQQIHDKIEKLEARSEALRKLASDYKLKYEGAVCEVKVLWEGLESVANHPDGYEMGEYDAHSMRGESQVAIGMRKKAKETLAKATKPTEGEVDENPPTNNSPIGQKDK